MQSRFKHFDFVLFWQTRKPTFGMLTQLALSEWNKVARQWNVDIQATSKQNTLMERQVNQAVTC